MGKSIPLFGIALLAIVAYVLTVAGLPGNMDAEPALAVAILLVASLACVASAQAEASPHGHAALFLEERSSPCH